jgi:YD repeat-containing protein
MHREKFIALLLLQCMYCSFLHAQFEQPTVVGLPNLLPPTPEAFALGKFGKNPIGLFTGTVQYAVSLYNINTGSISLPLSISYSSNGVKVDEVASRVGLQWKMDFGGVINRSVHGMPDGMGTLRPSTHDVNSTTFYNFMKTAGDAPNSYDTEPDEYSFSFAGYSGKFFIKNGQIISIPAGNVRIEQNSSVFTITTPDGTKYYFGENGCYDQSTTASAPVICQSDQFSPGYTTAWYLTRIVLRNGETINYLYDAIQGIDYPTGISQTFKFEPSVATYGENCAIMGNDVLNTCYQVITYYGVTLREIQFAQGRVRLVYSSREDVIDEKKLDSLIVENAEGLVLKKYAFSYNYSNASSSYDATMQGFYNPPQIEYPEIRKRLFLTKVQDCTISSDTANKYLFEYDDYNALPPRLSFAQDYWGYFNGKANTLLFPNYSGVHDVLRAWPSPGADRTASLTHGKKGMLKKITYPTGGTSNYLYEANTTTHGYDLNIPTYDTLTFSGNLGNPPAPFTSGNFSLNDGPCVIVIESIAAVDPPEENEPNQYDSLLHVKITDGSSNVVFENTVPIRASYAFTIDPAYISNLQLLAETDYPNVYYDIKIYSQNPLVPTHFTHMNGVRVAEVYDEDGLGSIKSHRVFKYHKWETPNTSSGSSNSASPGGPFYYSWVRTYGNTTDENIVQCAYLQLFSNSQYSVYSSGMGVNYGYVMEMTKDKNGTLTGGTEHKYMLTGQIPSITWGGYSTDVESFNGVPVPGCPSSNTDMFDGTEQEVKIFTLTNPTTRAVRQHTRNYFSVDDRKSVRDTVYTLRKVRTRQTYFPSIRYVSDYDISMYFVYSKWSHLDSTVATEYTAAGDSMVSKLQYEYWNEAHLMPSLVKTLDSKKDLRIVKKKYPGDIDTLPGPTYVTLAGKDTTEAIRERFYRNTDFLFTKYTKYKAWAANVIEPEYIEVADANETMSRVDFYGYTTRAKLKEVSKTGDVRISYIWDTVYNYPLAEVQNASVGDIAFTGFESNSQGSWSYNNSYTTPSNYLSGSKGFNLASGSITRSALSTSKEYTISFWATGSVSVSGGTLTVTGKTLGGWTNYLFNVTGVASTTISGTGFIDELRLYPKGAMMKSFSYKLLTGVNTVCDANNGFLFYEYDAAGRLSVVKDQDGNILKKYEYKYQSQQ